MSNPATPLSVLILAAIVVVIVFWPARGWYWQRVRLRRIGNRALVEDALKHFHHCEFCGLTATPDSLSGAVRVSRSRAVELVSQIEAMGLLERAGSNWRLNAEGRRYALRVIRNHRLWERYLAERTGVAETAWHEEADRREHTLSPEEAEALDDEMGHPRYDPHGAPIPTASGDVPPARGKPLTSLAVGDFARIVHVEDEPEAVYAQLAALGVSVGTTVLMVESRAERIRLEIDHEEHVLAPVVAANVSVVMLPKPQQAMDAAERLSDLQLGDRAEVVGLSPHCRGLGRRRLLDLGILPGTAVEAELQGPRGDPSAYRIRGALVALRKQQADLIRVVRKSNGVEG